MVYCSFPTYIGYFALGCYLGRTKKNDTLWLGVLLAVIGVVAAVAESYYWLGESPENNWLGLKASVQFLAFGVILMLFSRQMSENYKPTKLSRFVEWCGTQSMPIYMSHMLVCVAIGIVPLVSDYWILKWIAVFSIDVLFVKLLGRFLPKQFLPFIVIR